MMLTVEEAEKVLLEQALDWGVRSCALNEALGEILKEESRADRDFPPFDRVAMDGYAISRCEDVLGKTFPIQGEQKAGDPPLALESETHCISVSTGAVLPIGTQLVIKKEDVICHGDSVSVTLNLSQDNVHVKGSDYPKGRLLIDKHTRITPTQIGVLASIGKETVLVAKRPRIAIVSTGGELVPVSQAPLPHQIRQSNASVVKSALARDGFNDTHCFHLEDKYEDVELSMAQKLDAFDVIITLGGVSAGDFDFLPRALQSLSVKTLFYKVMQRPGKPFWAGRKGGAIVFALPGNPVSAMVCLYRYVLPSLSAYLGDMKRLSQTILLAEDIVFAKALTLFKPVQVSNIHGQLLAMPVHVNGSGDLASLVLSSGFVECDSKLERFPKGSSLAYYPWYR